MGIGVAAEVWRSGHCTEQMRTIAAAFLTVIALTAGNCTEAQRLDGREFQRQYELRDGQTMHVGEYLGQRQGRAYMRIKTMSTLFPEHWDEKLVFADLTDLDPDFKKLLDAEAKKY